jgi:hypothetical protein
MHGLVAMSIRPAGAAGGLSATQRLAMYIVISKPNRMSVAAGRSHFIVDLLLESCFASRPPGGNR